MDEVRRLLDRAECLQYAEKFEKCGYDSAGHLLSMGPADLDQVVKECFMLAGHMHRLKDLLARLNYQAHVLNAQDETEVGPPAEASAATESVTPKQPLQLKTRYATWPEAKLASYQFSTASGNCALLDRAKSSGRRKVIRCSSQVTRKRKNPDEEPRFCPHVLVWNKRQKDGGAWVLNEKTSVFSHTPMCSSQQNVTRMELVFDNEFVRHVRAAPRSTGTSEIKEALGGAAGRLDGSINNRTARRAKNDVMKFHDKDYDDDWSKLEGWKREYEEKKH